MNIAPAPSSPPPSWLAPPPSIHPSSDPSFKIANSSSSHDPTPYSTSAINGPYMGVVLVVLLITFFLMAAFSVYMRRFAFSLDRDQGPGTDRSGRGRGRGLDRATIDGLPIVVYHCAKGEAAATQVHEWSRRPDCVVCLTDFQEAEKLRLLPRCEHCFHPECIDMWLFSHSTCPLCRRSLLPPPLLPPPPPPPAAGNNEVYISVEAPRPAVVVPSDSTSAASSAPS